MLYLKDKGKIAESVISPPALFGISALLGEEYFILGSTRHPIYFHAMKYNNEFHILFQYLNCVGTMTSIIKFQAISGAMDESPPCFILQVDEFRILLDCGWDEKFDQEYMKELKKHVPLIDAVILSHPDPLHLGALPYLVGKCSLSCPIYATIPVYKMGQMFMYDLYQSRYNMEDFDLFTLDDVDAAFDKIIQLKFNQSVSMKGKGYGITITPLPGGHMIGGSIWKIFKVGEEDIIYAVDYNHKKERHLNGCELEKIQRPSLLITDAFNATYQQQRRRVRDEKLMTNILQTLRNNGNVLVTVDTAGRVLELAHMLEQLWRNKESGLLAYSLALLNNVSYNTVEFAKSQIEWMSEKLMRSFEGARNNPFQFKYVQLCHSFSELSKVSSPKVVLASTPDMESGFSRELFLQWCSNPLNSVILTSRTSPGSLARDLIDNGGDRTVNLEVKKRVKLEGKELEEYFKNEEERREQERENIDLSSESDDELEMIQVSRGRHDFLVKDTKPHSGFFKTNKKQNAMFPFYEQKVKFDDYGEIINPQMYRLEGEREKVEDIKDEVMEEEEKMEDQEVPTKCISYKKEVAIKAQIQYIDFEGRSDGESIQKIITQIRPRRLILVRGTNDSTKSLVNIIKKSTDAKIFAPQKKFEIVDATTETYIYQIRLTDQLISSLEFQKGKDAEVAWLDAQVLTKHRSADARPSEEEMEIDEELKDEILTLDLLPVEEIPGHDTSYINELKLSDFKQILNKNNINCEFSGGVLRCCQGSVAVRRHETGRVILEGCLSEDYYRVKDLLCQQYAIV